MKIKDYIYGTPSKSLKKASEYLNRNYTKIINKFILDENNKYRCDLDYLIMGHPEYCGIPKNITCRLNGDEVDWLQDEFEDLKCQYKEKTASRLNPIAKKYTIEGQKIIKKMNKIAPFMNAVN